MGSTFFASAFSNVTNPNHYAAIPDWHCEAGCGRSCAILKIEANVESLRIQYRCPVCGSTNTRQFDINAGGFMECDKSRADKSVNSENLINAARFCGNSCRYDKLHCAKIRRFLHTADYEAQFFEMAGKLVGRKCPGLSIDELKVCFSRFCANELDASAFARFQAAYIQESPENTGT